MAKVLIADKMDKQAEEIFHRSGIKVDVKPGLPEEELCQIVAEYDGIACRSSAKITANVIKAAKSLKVVGRAGIGVDTIDVLAATRAGIVVMNTPFGNSITTAEHTVAMMMALARQIPQASASTHAGKWEKSKFMGVELYGKTLGVIGCGNIGAIVAARAIGLGMRVLAYDPFLAQDRAEELGVTSSDLERVFAESDFITLHVPKTDKTTGMIDASSLARMKKGARIVNCARGGLIVEDDLKAALDSGHIAGAALDVFEVEPAENNVLFGHPNVICTPHLGASTTEAQVNVAIQVAEQMSAFLLTGAIANAVNTPSISAEEAPRLRPLMDLATRLGRFVAQTMDDEPLRKIEIEYKGEAAQLNAKPITSCAVAAILSGMTDKINMVNAMEIAQTKKIAISETRTDRDETWDTSLCLRIETESGREQKIGGTLMAGRDPRITEVFGVLIEAAFSPHMLLIRNNDKPGVIGKLGTLLGECGENIADFRLGRLAPNQMAVALIALDAPLPEGVLAKIKSLPEVARADRLEF